MNDAHDNAEADKSALRAAVEEIGDLTGLEVLAVVPGQAQAASRELLVTQREQADELAVQVGTQLHRALTALQLAESYCNQLVNECPDVTLHPELAENLRRLVVDCSLYCGGMKRLI